MNPLTKYNDLLNPNLTFEGLKVTNQDEQKGNASYFKVKFSKWLPMTCK